MLEAGVIALATIFIPMIYLFLGGDRQAKEQQIAKIKAACLPSDNALKFDYELLHGVKLDPDVLKKALIALPAVAKKRLILVRTPEKLNAQNKNIILEFIETENEHAVLILDSEETGLKNSFFNKVTAVAKVMQFAQGGKKRKIWDATRAIEQCNPSEALKILYGLMEEGNPPLKIMGALVWFWGDLKSRLPAERFKKGLLVLQEADLNIKRSRLKPEHAVEVAITNLSLLVAC